MALKAAWCDSHTCTEGVKHELLEGVALNIWGSQSHFGKLNKGGSYFSWKEGYCLLWCSGNVSHIVAAVFYSFQKENWNRGKSQFCLWCYNAKMKLKRFIVKSESWQRGEGNREKQSQKTMKAFRGNPYLLKANRRKFCLVLNKMCPNSCQALRLSLKQMLT